jgi:N-acetylglucosaminyldiphosphoundecaprenol N-acetyl-beta-D-mannosaminyltransferase
MTAAPLPSPPTITILGTDVALVTYTDALALFRSWLARSGPSRTVVAANVHLVTEAAMHADYAQAINDADLITPDGMPLVWASRLLGAALPERCYGPTLMEQTLDTFRDSGATHFFYGATPTVLAELQAAVKRRWPGVIVAGAHAPPFGPFDDQQERENIERINRSGARFVWLGMGCPKQEYWMARYRHEVHAPVIIAVGAAFDFIAGTVPQAPPLLQNLGLEWLFRLAREPRRLWKRYLVRNPYFIWRFTQQYLRARLARR